ncbi:MAG: AraC family transcriptional regulator [Ginsengibacter sp.]
MKFIDLRLPKDIDKSFTVFKEVGQYFPCPWHYHPEYELVLVIKSTGRRMVGDNIGYFKEGDLVFMGSLLPHVWVNDPKFIQGEAGYLAEAIVIHFTDDFLGGSILDIPEMEGFRKFLHLSKRGIGIKDKAREEINTIMVKMPGMNGLQRLSSLLSIFDILSDNVDFDLLASPGFVETMNHKESVRLKKIIEYVMQNFDEDINLSMAASMMNMGVTTFCNFFKDNYRMTFVEYINTVRIGHACKLLFDKDQTIAEVAYECGYNSLANFNRQFKKHKRLNPSEYKRMLVV